MFLCFRYPQKSHIVCTDQRCSIAITVAYILPAFICIPSYMVFSIRATKVVEDSTLVTLYHLDLSDVAKEDNELLYNINFWVYAVVIKLLPCAILTVISYWLIVVLYRVNQRKQRLKSDVYNLGSGSGGTATTAADNRLLPQTDNRKNNKAEKRMDRTTRMLVAVLLLFLITEFPQGILGLLSGILGRCFFRTCYHLFGEVMDILALINGAINFILYCSMSRQFRTTFGELFKPKLLAKWAPTQTEVQTTYV